MSNIAQNKILKNLKADLTNAEASQKELTGKIAQWTAEYNGEPYGNESAGKSKLVSRDIKKQVDAEHSSLVDPFLSTDSIVKAHPVTYEDAEAAKQSEVLLNNQFCRQFNRYAFVTKAIKVLAREGTVVVRTGWDYKGKDVEIDVPTIDVDEWGREYVSGFTTATETKTLVNKPTAIVCRNEDVFIDPTCMGDMDNCQFVVHRYETDLSTLTKDGKYKNLNKIKKSDDDSSGLYGGTDYDAEDDTVFQYEDDPRKKHLVHEYWGNYDMNGDGIAEPIVCVWINDTIIRLQDNPYPDGKPPFIVVPFNSVPFQMHGEATAELISDNQKIKTAITRGIIDNMAQSNNGQKGIKIGALNATNRKKYFNNENFEYNTTAADFYDGSYNNIPGSVFQFLETNNREIEANTGVMVYGGQNAAAGLGASATASRGVMDANAIRRMDKVRGISENLFVPLFRKWLAYDNEFMEEQEIVRNTNAEFVEINKDDLSGKIDISLTIATAEDNQAKSQELSFLLQTLGNTVPFEITQMLMADLLELMRMPDKSKTLREFEKPAADPVEAENKQLANELLKAQIADTYAKANSDEDPRIAQERAMLENAQLKAKIMQLQAKTQEDQGDSAEKYAKARLLEAQTEKLRSETDRIDMDFLAQNSGTKERTEFMKDATKHQQALELKQIDMLIAEKKEEVAANGKYDEMMTKRQFELEDKEIDRQVNLESIAAQKSAGDTNIGIIK